MRFFIGIIILFGASFGAVSYFGGASGPPPADVITILKTQPEEYARVYTAFQTIQSDEIGELDRSFLAFGKHQNEQALRQDIGGPMVRAIATEAASMEASGRTRLEKFNRRNLGLLRKYLRYGDDFCELTVKGDYGSAEKRLRNSLANKKEADKLLVEFKQERFEIAVLALDTIAAGRRDPVSVPSFSQKDMGKALEDAATEEQARIINGIDEGYNRTCRETEALLDAALSIKDNDMRHHALALLSGQ